MVKVPRKKKQLLKIKKLNQDDILEILIEHFWGEDCADLLNAKATILGFPNEDLRAVCVFGDVNNFEISKLDLGKIDAENDFNGYHAFLERNPEFYLQFDQEDASQTEQKIIPES